jgi:Holliday junction resolvase RusA-like endonuclease
VTLTIVLPGVPRGKGRPRISTKGGFPRAYTDAKTRSYETLLRDAGATAMAGSPVLEGPLTVNVEARFPVPASWSRRKRAAALAGELRPTGRPDMDNVVKTLDALNWVVWKDDAQIVTMRVFKRYSEEPALKITVWNSGEAA